MSADQLRAVECELSKKEVEARSLQSQLATCAQHVEEYKAIAKTVEEEFAHFKAAKEAEEKSSAMSHFTKMSSTLALSRASRKTSRKMPEARNIS